MKKVNKGKEDSKSKIEDEGEGSDEGTNEGGANLGRVRRRSNTRRIYRVPNLG